CSGFGRSIVYSLFVDCFLASLTGYGGFLKITRVNSNPTRASDYKKPRYTASVHTMHQSFTVSSRAMVAGKVQTCFLFTCLMANRPLAVRFLLFCGRCS